MEVDSRAIDEVLAGARKQSERHTSFYRFINRLVIPGMVLQLDQDVKQSWSLGPGLCLIPTPYSQTAEPSQTADSVLIRQFGVLKHFVGSDRSMDIQRVKSSKSKSSEPAMESTQFLWLESPGQCSTNSLSAICRYSFRCPVTLLHVGDRVVGVIIRRVGDYYMVDIGCSSPASLSYLSFEGASKKNRPDLNVGDVVYAMVTQADRDLEVELSCMDESGRASGMGILGRHEPGTVGNAGGMDGGVMLHCTPELIRRLADSDQFPLLPLLAKIFPFEVCLGTNGRIWLTARSPRETMLLANTIALADQIPGEQCCTFAKNLVA